MRLSQFLPRSYSYIPYIIHVSLSNKLDKELKGRTLVERIQAFLVFLVAAFHLAIMSGHVRTDPLVLDTQLSGGFLKNGGIVGTGTVPGL